MVDAQKKVRIIITIIMVDTQKKVCVIITILIIIITITSLTK